MSIFIDWSKGDIRAAAARCPRLSVSRVLLSLAKPRAYAVITNVYRSPYSWVYPNWINSETGCEF